MKPSVKICCGMNCLTHGGQELLDILESNAQYRSSFLIESVECLNTCGDYGYQSPVVEVDGQIYPKMTTERLMELLDELLP